ncbi:uncharacterized protein LOC123038080 [Drosophila rhopaloa]|uniref:Uncharacterized protein n=1 Tax=Drosophila rhopaloa TaxID=1041015 RepID=A0ABM5JFH4_DRORH|nr:uncharacterized protein LOC123038080 [Drosophila rhopaloa]
MSNVTLIFAIACLCVAVQAQTGRPRDREICANENSRCERNQRRLGRDNDVSNVFNNHCRQSNRGWRNISHCELTLATCRLTLENCSIINCANVRRSLAGGTTGRPTPSSRTTTPRIPSPQTTRRGPGPSNQDASSSNYS